MNKSNRVSEKEKTKERETEREKNIDSKVGRGEGEGGDKTLIFKKQFSAWLMQKNILVWLFDAHFVLSVFRTAKQDLKAML